jgi:pseudouridine synthase
MQKRLQKFLSEIGYCSRRQAETLIRKGQITINGQTATLGDRVTQEDTVVVQGKKITPPKKENKIIIAYHKPTGVECTLKKIPGETTLADIDFKKGRVFPIGRLDKNSRGLLLLTNDGDLGNKLAHPRYQHEKEYLVTIQQPVEGSTLQKLEKGITLAGRKTKKCTALKIDTHRFSIIIEEGRNRQIRRMCQAVDWKVLDLFRIRIGRTKLNELKEGRWRIFSEKEMQNLKNMLES